MRGLVVGIVGALVLGASASGLVALALRPGPYDLRLEAETRLVAVSGTYERTSGMAEVLGVCPGVSCEPSTSFDLLFTGLPTAPYTAALTGAPGVELGALQPEAEGAYRLHWSRAEDHLDKGALVLRVAGLAVATIGLRDQAGTQGLQVQEVVGLQTPSGDLHVGEIGGITVSTVAAGHLDFAVPAGWELRAGLVGDGGDVDLGTFDQDADGGRALLDARVERVRLADHDGLRVVLAPQDAPRGEGFPVLVGSF